MDREPEVTRFVDGPWDDPIAHRNFIVARTSAPYPPGLGYWTVLVGGQHFAGWVLLIPLDAKGPEVEIGWRIEPKFWGKGLASEAAGPVLSHGFNSVGLSEIVADIDVLNTASRRVAEKLGLHLRAEGMHHGRRSVRYSATKEEFTAATTG